MKLTIEAMLKRFPIITTRLSQETIMQLFRYLIVGFTSFAIEYALFVLFRKLLPFPELIVNISIYTLIFWFNFLLNRMYSFRSKNGIFRQIISYSLLFAFNLVVGNIVLFSLFRQLFVIWTGENSWPVLYLPKIMIMFFIVSWNFILYKKVIYK